MFIIPLIPVTINFFLLVMAWSNQASWYGYRYISFVIMPLMILPLADALKRVEDNLGKSICCYNLCQSISSFFNALL